jgi:hypothetical protein
MLEPQAGCGDAEYPKRIMTPEGGSPVALVTNTYDNYGTVCARGMGRRAFGETWRRRCLQDGVTQTAPRLKSRTTDRSD